MAEKPPVMPAETLITPPTPQMPPMGLGAMAGTPTQIGNIMEAPVVPAEDVPFCVTPDKYQSYKTIFANQGSLFFVLQFFYDISISRTSSIRT